MEKHKCKLCVKSFVSGRALGGHMRSHMFNLPIRPDKPHEEQPSQLGAELESASSRSSSSYYYYDGDNKNGNKGVLVADPEFSSSVVLQDRESETESSKNPTRKRSTRTRKPSCVSFGQLSRNEEESSERTKKKVRPSQLTESWAEPEPASSVSDVTRTEEDVAFCLMMLSRDSWVKTEQENPEEEEEEEEESESDERDEFNGSVKKKRNYKCETCGKVFRSYQALGGHRASHKKNRATTEQVSSEDQETLKSCVKDQKSTKKKNDIHECPVCFRVFSSGQALGGHKRSHPAGSIVVGEASPAKTSERRVSSIDLNLPAPTEDDDLVSAVFDDDAPEFAIGGQ